jgi:hypothetical protein
MFKSKGLMINMTSITQPHHKSKDGLVFSLKALTKAKRTINTFNEKTEMHLWGGGDSRFQK